MLSFASMDPVTYADGDQVDSVEIAAEAIRYKYTFLPERACTGIDPRVEPLLGYDIADFLGNPAHLFDIVHPQDRADYFSLLSGGVASACIRWLRRDGSSVWCEHVVTLRRHEGTVVSMEGAAWRVAPPPGRCGRMHPACERLEVVL